MADILLIDDMPEVRHAVGYMLKHAGHAIVTAENGEEGLSRLNERSFDLVITDMLMPKLDGAGVLRHVKNLANRPPVIAMSGGGAGQSAQEALRSARSNADAFLEKPFDKGDLLAAVDRLLAKRESRRPAA